MNDINERTDRLLELANNTDGLAVINSNDLNPGLARIANDLSAYYVLGYYTAGAGSTTDKKLLAIRIVR